VVSVDKKGALKKRTMKVMQGIMAGLWIVSTRWLSDSLAAGAMLAEEVYFCTCMPLIFMYMCIGAYNYIKICIYIYL
jgi:hypothetical protein